MILEFVTLFLILSTDFLPKSISKDVGKTLHLHEIISVIAGVNERVLSLMSLRNGN